MESRRRARGFRFVPMVLALGLLGVVGPAANAQATCTVSSADQVIDSEEHKFLQLINQYRLANGRSALTGHPDVTRAAAWMSRDMASHNNLPLNHIDSNGRYIDARIGWCGATFGSWAENIYAGTTGLAQDAFDWWKNSSTHNTNMLSSAVSSIGISRAFQAGTTYGYYWTTDFTDSRRDPVANFDNDLDSERSVYRPSTGQWFVEGSSPVSFGLSGDVPVPGDYDGDGDADIAVYRPSNGSWLIKDQTTQFLGGSAGDIPVPADYDGDGDTDTAIFRPSVGGWFITGMATVFYGLSGDIPVPGDYDGQGGVDVAVFRPTVGGWYRNGAATVFHGFSGDIPVPANYDTDRDDDIAIFRPPVGGWYFSGGGATFFGLSGDFPVPGNLDADVNADVGVFRRPVGGWYVNGGGAAFLGAPGDIPLLLPIHIQRFFTFSGA